MKALLYPKVQPILPQTLEQKIAYLILFQRCVTGAAASTLVSKRAYFHILLTNGDGVD